MWFTIFSAIIFAIFFANTRKLRKIIHNPYVGEISALEKKVKFSKIDQLNILNNRSSFSFTHGQIKRESSITKVSEPTRIYSQ